MHKGASVLIVAVLFVTLGSKVYGQTAITGRLIDMACCAQNKENTGNQHKEKGKGSICAQACALEGFPVGLLTADGKVYQVMGDLAAHSNTKLVPHMTQVVTLTGEIQEKDGNKIIMAADLRVVNP